MERTVLSKYVDIAPRDWRFAVNEYGRPSIAAEHTDARGIEFNLSHTDGLVVMAVTRGRAIGVDVENVRTREVDIDIVDRYFAAEEVAALRALPREKQKQRFFECWTLKESYIKARGLGLSIPLERFAFDLEDAQQIRLTIDPGLKDRSGRWSFWHVTLGHDHLTATLCTCMGCNQLPLELTGASQW
jgi:4'-phosphopantetheinyl transferase